MGGDGDTEWGQAWLLWAAAHFQVWTEEKRPEGVEKAPLPAPRCLSSTVASAQAGGMQAGVSPALYQPAMSTPSPALAWG